jgi:hypothetical protein
MAAKNNNKSPILDNYSDAIDDEDQSHQENASGAPAENRW